MFFLIRHQKIIFLKLENQVSMMENKQSGLTLILFLTILLSVCVRASDASDMTTLPESISIKSVNALRLLTSPDALRIILTLQNEGDYEISVQNGRFHVIINPESVPSGQIPAFQKEMLANLGGDDRVLPDTKLELGKTKPLSFKIRPCADFGEDGECRHPGQTAVSVEIPLPSHSAERAHIICKLLNYMGFPGSRKEIALLGNVDVDIRGKTGGKRRKLRLELYYAPPKIQSEVLFFGW